MKHLCFLCAMLTGSVWAQGQELVVEKLPPYINSPYNEITPVPSRDGSRLFFTRVAYPEFDPTLIMDSLDILAQYPLEVYRERLSWVFGQLSGKGGYVSDPSTSPFNQDIWIAMADSTGFLPPIHPKHPLNNVLPNSFVTITPDPHAFYVINQFELNGNMKRGFSLIRELPDGTWDFPQAVQIDEYYTITSDVSLTMSFDGEILILSATRYDSKDMDLYVCFRTKEDQWTAPQHLAKTLNSERRETTPYLSEDNTTLFFSSNRGESIGGNDIFMSKRLDDTWKSWSEQVRLTKPVNSIADDSQPYFNMSTGYLYFTSKRDGNSDIFRIQLAPAQPTEITIRGRILNRKTGRLIPDAEIDYSSKRSPINTIACPDGTFSLKIPKGIPFAIVPHMPGFMGQTDTISLRRDYVYFGDQYVDVFMYPLQKNDKIELRPIYFQQSEAIILPTSLPELRRLSQVLKENTNIHIRIEGHTDNIGKAADLLQLSQDRADAIKTFLNKEGIEIERIETIGHGPKFPINENDSADKRALNRRVEIYVTKS